MKISDFDYELPRELVAQAPAAERDASRLMVVPREGAFEHRVFRDLPAFLGPGDLLVLNDTRVVPARVIARRATGGRVEVLLVERVAPGLWRAMLDSPRRLKPGEALSAEGVCLRLEGRDDDGLHRLAVEGEERLRDIGEPPLPPYIRARSPADRERYQTVYARAEGSIAAPTAGLHFTDHLLEEIRGRGARVAFLTLHVGVGTFRPVRVELVEDHRMPPEGYEIPAGTLDALAHARRVVAVGTTVTRALESWARSREASGRTDLFIRPPFDFRVVRALVTNFHLPRGTPLLLAAAFAGRQRLRSAYEEAIRQRYRFYSYGDAMLIEGLTTG